MTAQRDVARTGRASARIRDKRAPLGVREHGQSAVFVLLFLGILLISLNFLYKQGRVTSDKMEMQNAADAIAYSISITEARDLNFAAYLNRAMVANEVAIGQLMGLASWAILVNSYADFLNAYVQPLQYIPIVNAIPATFYSITGVLFRTPGAVLTRFLGTIANFGTSFLHFSNKAYGYAQLGYHVTTVIISASTIQEMLKENAPPGTRISSYGWMSLLSHFATAGSLGSAVTLAEDLSGRSVPGIPWPSGTPDSIKDQFKQYVESYNPAREVAVDDYTSGEKGDAEAYERFAAITRDSRDPFTLNRSWELKPFEFIKPIIDPLPLLSVRDGNINVDIDFSFALCRDLGICIPTVDGGVDFDLNFYFGIAIARDGASELRLLIPSTGTFEAGNVANWSSADVSSLAAELGASFNIRVWATALGLRAEGRGNGAFDLADEKLDFAGLTIGVTLGLPWPVPDITFDVPVVPGFEVPFPTSAPFGAAFSEAGKTTPNNNKLGTMSTIGGPVPLTAYGGAANRAIAWSVPAVPSPFVSVPPGFMPPGVMQRSDTFVGPTTGDMTTRVNKNYPGLPPYLDTSGVDQTLFGFGAPQLTVSLVLDEADHDLNRGDVLVDPATAGNHPEMGHASTALTSEGLRLQDGMAGGAGLLAPFGSTPKLHTVGSSEVYFKRPNDLDWFKRLDDREEHGSAFNPYWHARLVETPYLQSVTALAVEQQEDFTGATELISQVMGDIESMLEPWFDVLDSLGLSL